MNDEHAGHPTPHGPAPVLRMEDLAVEFPGAAGEAVSSVHLEVGRGEAAGLVGESGSGKTLTALAALGLIDVIGGRITRGRVRFHGEDVTDSTPAQWRAIRGNRAALVFQQPMRSLNPALTVGEQIAEPIRQHWKWDRKRAWKRAVELLDRVHIPDPHRRAQEYAHQFSGGMAQRVVIAMALACDPELLIADEPTTALDVRVQERILALFQEVMDDGELSILYISHDLALVSQFCSRVTVMYAGQTVESARTEDLFADPRHPYTDGLIRAIPRLGQRERLTAIPGSVPMPGEMPTGCRFFNRCGHAVDGICSREIGGLNTVGDERSTRCVRHEEVFGGAGQETS